MNVSEPANAGRPKVPQKRGARPPTGRTVKDDRPAAPAPNVSALDEALFLLAATCLVEDGPWLKMERDFNAMAVAARDLAFECSACTDGHRSWCPGEDLQSAFQMALHRLQQRRHSVPNMTGPNDDLNGTVDEHLQALLRKECPPVFDPKWGVPRQSILENGALACRRIAAEARRLHARAVAARKQGKSKGGRIPEAGLNGFVEYCAGWGVPLKQMVRVMTPYMPGLGETKLRELLKRRRRAMR